MAARLTRAEEPRLAELFAAFRQPGVTSLLGIGLWYLVMLMSVAFLVTLLAVALGLAPSPEALQAEPISQDTMDQLLTLGMMVMLAALPVAAALAGARAGDFRAGQRRRGDGAACASCGAIWAHLPCICRAWRY